MPEKMGFDIIEKVDEIRFSKGKHSVDEIREKMQVAMSKYCGVFRKKNFLVKGVKEIREAFEMYKNLKIKDRGLVWNTDLIEALELENLLIQAL